MPNRAIQHEISQGADCIIVGQGIAGTLLAHFLVAKGKRVHIFDPGDASAASSVAAGIMNPITGRNFVKTWMADQLFPFAIETYQSIGALLGEEFYRPYPILRALPDTKAENDWFAKCGSGELEGFVFKEGERCGFDMNIVGSELKFASLESRLKSALLETLQGDHSYAYINGGKCDLSRLTTAYRKWFLKQGMLTQERFDFENIAPEDLPCPIVFCEGSRGKDNPFFTGQPIQPAKGEVLIVKIPDYPFEQYIIKHDIFIAPLGDGLYWVGSNYEHQFEDASPTPSRRAALEESLGGMLKLPFEVVDHKAAIRPTTKTRRPLLVQHDVYNKLFLFNGLGTKGATLGPWFAREMAGRVL